MSSINSLVVKISNYNKNTDTILIKRIYEFAKLAHKNERRLSGEAYINHPIRVASILANLGADDKTIAAALLHDVIENCNISYKQIEKEFGSEIAFLVEGVTKISTLKFRDKEELDIENIKKLLFASAKDIRVILIKLADRLDNMRTLEYLPKESQLSISRFTMEVYAPIAYRLGLGEIKAELEDLSFKYLNPSEYNTIQKKLDLTILERKNLVEKAKSIILKKLKDNNLHRRVDGRAKHIYSIYRKLHLKNYKFDQIFDLIAIRIIVNTVADCYNVLGIVHSIWKPIPGYLKDYIATPKENMYRSIHTVVIGPGEKPLEVQIKTEEMHLVNEEGIAAHYRYKGFKEDERFHKKLKWLREILEWQTDTNYRDFIENLKVDFFDYEIYVFTPKGDVIKLPAEATPIDFAYQVHSQIGDNCIGAMVNNKYVALDYKLNNGDIVKIITQKNHKPNKDWLKFVRTDKAKSKIIRALKLQGIPISHYSKLISLHENLIKVDSIKNPKIKFSKCCSAVPTDKIKGYLRLGDFVMIHNNTCKVIKGNIVKEVSVSWNTNFNSDIKLKVTAKDRIGLVGELMTILYNNKVNVVKVFARTIDKEIGECDFIIHINNIKILADLINDLKSVEGLKRIHANEIVIS